MGVLYPVLNHFIMEKRKYNRSLDSMQIFAFKNVELNKIKGGNFFDDFVEWTITLLYTDPYDDGAIGHGGGPK